MFVAELYQICPAVGVAGALVSGGRFAPAPDEEVMYFVLVPLIISKRSVKFVGVKEVAACGPNTGSSTLNKESFEKPLICVASMANGA